MSRPHLHHRRLVVEQLEDRRAPSDTLGSILSHIHDEGYFVTTVDDEGATRLAAPLSPPDDSVHAGTLMTTTEAPSPSSAATAPEAVEGKNSSSDGPSFRLTTIGDTFGLLILFDQEPQDVSKSTNTSLASELGGAEGAQLAEVPAPGPAPRNVVVADTISFSGATASGTAKTPPQIISFDPDPGSPGGAGTSGEYDPYQGPPPAPTISLTIGNSNFIPYNANDTNGSPKTDGVPQFRDLNVNPMRSWRPGDTEPAGPLIADPELVTATVTVGNWFALGAITWQVNIKPGGGQIRFWQEATKEHQYPVNPGGPTSTFYIEGTDNSAALNDVTIKFFYDIQMPGQPPQHVETSQNVTVTPMVESFSVTPKAPATVTLGKDAAGRVVGLNSGQQSADGMPPGSGAVGATFASSVNKSGVGGDKFLVQNMMEVNNGAGGGLVFTAASGRPSLRLLPTSEALPLLDKVDAELPPPPDYTRDTDTPFIQHDAAVFADIQTVDILEKLKLFLMFRYSDTSIVTLAYIEWQVYFKAARNAAGGLDIDPSSITSANSFVRSHALPPKLNSPSTPKITFNTGMSFQ